MKYLRSTFIILMMMTFLLSACNKELVQLNPPVANAGPSKAIQLPVSTVSLSGSGTTENGSIVGYLWSMVSGPGNPVIVSPGSATTVINNMVAGNYIFQLMVTDNVGLTGFDTTSVTVSPALQQTITLQPANSTINELNFAVIGTQDVSAHDIDLDAAAWTSGGVPFYIRGAFKFDLSSIPPTSTIISARLSLYSNPTPINGDRTNANSGVNNAMYIRRIVSNWNGTTATWQTQPVTSSADQLLVPHTSLPVLDLVDVDVTNLVTTMHITNNYGFMIMLQNEVALTIRQFCSSNHPVTAKRPKLIVVYQ